MVDEADHRPLNGAKGRGAAVNQRDTNRQLKRQAVIDAGLARLLSGPIGALRSVVNASSLSAEAGLSKDTTYRLFKDGDGHSNDAIIREVAAAASRPAWAGFAESSKAMATAFQDALRQEVPFTDLLIDIMAANVESQFRSPGGPTGWLLHAAAITASPAWRGERHLSAEDRRLGEELLAVRADFYRTMTDDLSPLLAAAMSLINRRPRPGMDPRRLIALIHAMIDGAVLRWYIDPDTFDSTLIGEATYALAIAFTEEGALDDPRRPTDPDAETEYDALLQEAATAWERSPGRTVGSTALDCSVEPHRAALLFPTDADLADGVIWNLVLGGGTLVRTPFAPLPGGSEGQEQATGPALLLGILRRLREVVEELPGAAELVRDEKPAVGIGVSAQLQHEAAEIIRRHCPGVDPRITAGELVASALTGDAGWPAVTSLMRVVDAGAPVPTDWRSARPE